MAQAKTLLVTSDALQIRVGGADYSDSFGVSQVVVSGVPFQKMGFEQREGKWTRHSGDYGGALPKSYHSQSSRHIHAAIPASEAGYVRHSSSSSVHTSQGSSTKYVGCRGHSSHLGSSHQPMSHRGCFEYGYTGHFVRFPLTKCGGLHLGSQASTLRDA
ncbi:hypothetical protein H5410_060196 [Solanum commersonii]|uniref:Uncharacterized protein n=1 Tax=Solanum commersonii TaxID=4109 RepID=A0A9J5W5T1_SOLCO|nr:hypothetical protein H5410_060196 [Solanum commersonii]